MAEAAQEVAAQGLLQGLPYPEGRFEELAKWGDDLLSSDDWHVTSTKEGFKQMKKASDDWHKPIAGGEGVFVNRTVDECVDTMVRQMKENSPKWDKTFITVDVVDSWSNQDFCYNYKINPGFPLAKRDMVYYEGWRKDAATGVVVNVSGFVPELEAATPLEPGWVRSRIHLHYKRFTPVDGGTKYETLQQIDIGGQIPNRLAFSGVLAGLRKEFVGFTNIMEANRPAGH
eukprot:m.36485 g.36485  ORF g.36485 m.36485 type:complete len:229 (-) comp11022_c0_seq2:381-1067(-)